MEQQRVSKSAPHPPQAMQSATGCQTRLFDRFFTFAAFLFLTANTAAAAFRFRHRPSALAFFAFCYGDLLLIFLCLRSFERLGTDADGGVVPPEKKEGLKAAIWLLATALDLAFSWSVAAVVPPALGCVVGVLAASVAVGGFYFLFLHREDADRDGYRAVKSKELSAEEKV